MARLEETRKKVEDGIRLSREEGVALLRDADLLELGALADTVRWRKHPEAVVTYIINRNINYTNVCTAQCAFCAFYRDLPSKEGYLSEARLSQKIEETIALGGPEILLQGRLRPDLGIEYYEELFRWMKASYPIWIHGLSPAEVQHIVRASKLVSKKPFAIDGRGRSPGGAPDPADRVADHRIAKGQSPALEEVRRRRIRMAPPRR
jgi:cyclic dehypoxanthinyl futalosine synthase